MLDDSFSVSGFLSDFVIVNGLSILHELLHAKCKKSISNFLVCPLYWVCFLLGSKSTNNNHAVFGERAVIKQSLGLWYNPI